MMTTKEGPQNRARKHDHALTTEKKQLMFTMYHHLDISFHDAPGVLIIFLILHGEGIVRNFGGRLVVSGCFLLGIGEVA